MLLSLLLLFFNSSHAYFPLFHRAYLYSCFKSLSIYSDTCVILGLTSNNFFGVDFIFLICYTPSNLYDVPKMMNIISWSLWIMIHILKSLNVFIYQAVNLVDLNYISCLLVVSSNSNSVILSYAELLTFYLHVCIYRVIQGLDRVKHRIRGFINLALSFL